MRFDEARTVLPGLLDDLVRWREARRKFNPAMDNRTLDRAISFLAELKAQLDSEAHRA